MTPLEKANKEQEIIELLGQLSNRNPGDFVDIAIGGMDNFVEVREIIAKQVYRVLGSWEGIGYSQSARLGYFRVYVKQPQVEDTPKQLSSGAIEARDTQTIRDAIDTLKTLPKGQRVDIKIEDDTDLPTLRGVLAREVYRNLGWQGVGWSQAKTGYLQLYFKV